MADDVRQQIINSVFSKRNPASGELEETYIAHVKVWETDDTGTKSRFILLAVDRQGAGLIHKSKQNTNGAFQIGKTWKLEDLRSLEVVPPNIVRITFARSSRWQTESEKDQTNFLNACVRLHRRVTDNAPLSLIGFTVPAGNASNQSKFPEQQPQPEPPRSQTPTGTSASVPQGVSPRRLNRVPSASSFGAAPRPSSPLRRDRAQALYFGDISVLDAQQAESSTSTKNHLTTGSSLEATRQPSRGPSPLRGAERLRPPAGRERSAERTAAPARNDYRERVGARDRPEDRTRGVNQGTQGKSKEGDSLKIANLNEYESGLGEDMDGGVGVASENGASSLPVSKPASLASHTLHVPAGLQDPTPSPKRDVHTRVSFFDPVNQTAADRLLSAGPGRGIALGGMGLAGEDEATEGTMANVEEMLEGIEWGFGGGYGGLSGAKGKKGAADMIEARLLDELMALEKANIHSFLESDDRIATVLNYIDDAMKELDEMDAFISAYKVHLNAVGDDIGHIQSQDRGLQVQTQNQKLLLAELQDLLQTLDVPREALITLTQQSLENHKTLPKLEEAAAELYKALLAGQETGMAASIERLEEYRTHNAQFCKRVFDFLNIAFKFQSDKTFNAVDKDKKFDKQKRKPRPSLPAHEAMESYLGSYSGLMLYLKEMAEEKYSKVCALYFSTSSELHSKEMKSLFMSYINIVKKAEEDPELSSFSPPVAQGTISRAGGTVRRAGTIVRSPMRDRKPPPAVDGEIRGYEALTEMLELLISQVHREELFIADFLQITDASITFADYMGLENYIRRKASGSNAGVRQASFKLVRGAMDLIFGFLPEELKLWIDGALQKDPLQIVGLIAATEQALSQLEERSNVFLQRLLTKQHQRLTMLYNRHVDEQIKAIEQTKLASKKRRGVAHFIKYFPVYLERIENQLSVFANSDLEVRGVADTAYEKIIQAMFECLQQIAKMDIIESRDAEDKGQLNYHIIMIENMHYFVAEVSQHEMGAVSSFLKRAQTTYDDSLDAYVKLVIRRPLGKIMDYFDGVERILQTTAPSEVSNNPNFNKSALKKVLKDFNAKDMRRIIEALFKRLEKHFAEDDSVSPTGKITAGTAMVDVWKSCEDKVVRDTKVFTRLISQCYGDSGINLEYSIADVEAGFKRHR